MNINFILKKEINWLVCFFSFIVLSINTAYSQTPFLAATANKSTIGLNEQLQITYTFNGAGRAFHGPDLRDFNILSGPNQSSNMQYINGQFSQSISFTYYLQARKEGNYKIGPASIEAEGKRIASNVIQIVVVKGTAQQQQKTNEDESILSSKNIFAKAILSKGNLMKGESTLLTFKLYSNVTLVDFAIPKMPNYDGFWNQDIQLPQALERNTEVIDGQRYTVWEIKKLVLFPQQSGVLTIQPMEIECIARVKVNSQRSNDPFSIFNDPFFGMGGVKDIKYSFKSDPIRIKVNDLPGNPPPGFSGAVGNLNFDAKLDKNKTKANEAISLKLKISGNGNLKLADFPSIEFPNDLESYDPKVSENFKASVSGVNGTKSIEYLIIPRHEGEYEIPAFTFTYFDLNKKQYISKTEGPYTIQVGKGSEGMATASSGTTEKSEFRLIGNDIRYIKIQEPNFNQGLNNFYGSTLFYTLSLCPFILFGGVFFWQQQRNKLAGNTVLLKRKNATNVARKRLTAARKLLESKQDAQVLEEIHKALMGYIGDKFSLPLSEMSKDRASSLLQEQNVKEELIQEYLKNIDECEMARYGGLSSGISAASIYASAEKVISEIEGGLKS
jgi:BatD DUF11 like domain